MLKYNVVAKKNPITKAVKYYAQLVPVTPIKLADLSELISNECTLTAHDVKAVISALEEQVTRALLDGKSVRLGDLGSFHPTVKSKGADAANKFQSTDIEKVNVRFVKNGVMRYNFSVASPKVTFANDAQKAAATAPGA